MKLNGSKRMSIPPTEIDITRKLPILFRSDFDYPMSNKLQRQQEQQQLAQFPNLSRSNDVVGNSRFYNNSNAADSRNGGSSNRINSKQQEYSNQSYVNRRNLTNNYNLNVTANDKSHVDITFMSSNKRLTPIVVGRVDNSNSNSSRNSFFNQNNQYNKNNEDNQRKQSIPARENMAILSGNTDDLNSEGNEDTRGGTSGDSSNGDGLSSNETIPNNSANVSDEEEEKEEEEEDVDDDNPNRRQGNEDTGEDDENNEKDEEEQSDHETNTNLDISHNQSQTELARYLSPLLLSQTLPNSMPILFTAKAVRPSYEQICSSILDGNLAQLEKFVLDGFGSQLYSWRNAPICIDSNANASVVQFIANIPQYQYKIYAIHGAIATGEPFQLIEQLIGDKRELLLCRDQFGATPLHKAVLYQRIHVVQSIIDLFPLTMELADNNGYTPLHYAAFLPENKPIYRLLIESGASTTATDMYHRRPEDYLQECNSPSPPLSYRVYNRKRSINPPLTLVSGNNPYAIPVQVGKSSHNSSNSNKNNRKSTRNKHNTDIVDYRAPFRQYEDPGGVLTNYPKSADENFNFESCYDQWWQREHLHFNDPVTAVATARSIIDQSIHGQQSLNNHLPSIPLSPPTIVEPTFHKPKKSSHKNKCRSHTTIPPINIPANSQIYNNNNNNEDYFHNNRHHQSSISTKRSRNNLSPVQTTTFPSYSLPFFEQQATHPNLLYCGSPSPSRHHHHHRKSSPIPITMNRFNIKEMIRQGNLAALEEMVLYGHGDRLLGESSTAPMVQEFLDNLPDYLDQINELHKASARGNVREFQSLLDRNSLILSRDPLGATPLHKAVLYGHLELSEYISKTFGASAIDARDNEGRTPLHYSAGLVDDRAIYHMLIKNGAQTNIVDQKNKTADFYLRFPDELNLVHTMKRSQRLNANHAINLANRIKSKSPSRRKERSLSPAYSRNRFNSNGFYGSYNGINNPDLDTDQEVSSNEGSVKSFASNMKRSNNQALNPILRMEINSANLRRWIEENNIEMLEGAVLEGHGDRLRRKANDILKDGDNVGSQTYIEETVPKIMDRIQHIHAAVSCGDLTSLQEGLETKKDYILSKDHLGMTPLHKATIMGHLDVVQYILEKFPETVNARDREGRTALHYSTATTNRNGNKIYKMLIRAGADSKVRDLHAKTADYYRVHLLSISNEMLRVPIVKNGGSSGGGGVATSGPIKKSASGLLGESNSKTRRIMQPQIREKINNSLHTGNVTQLQELLIDGYGQELIGRTSFVEDARKFLKTIPQGLELIREIQEATINGDQELVEKILSENGQSFARVRDINSFTLMHLATIGGQLNLVNYFAEQFPAIIHLKDNMGRTSLHLAALTGNGDIYRRLVELGLDPRSLDQKGKTSDYYLRNNPAISSGELQELMALTTNTAQANNSTGTASASTNGGIGQHGVNRASKFNRTKSFDTNNGITGNSVKISTKPARLPALSLPNQATSPPANGIRTNKSKQEDEEEQKEEEESSKLDQQQQKQSTESADDSQMDEICDNNAVKNDNPDESMTNEAKTTVTAADDQQYSAVENDADKSTESNPQTEEIKADNAKEEKEESKSEVADANPANNQTQAEQSNEPVKLSDENSNELQQTDANIDEKTNVDSNQTGDQSQVDESNESPNVEATTEPAQSDNPSPEPSAPEIEPKPEVATSESDDKLASDSAVISSNQAEDNPADGNIGTKEKIASNEVEENLNLATSETGKMDQSILKSPSPEQVIVYSRQSARSSNNGDNSEAQWENIDQVVAELQEIQPESQEKQVPTEESNPSEAKPENADQTEPESTEQNVSNEEEKSTKLDDSNLASNNADAVPGAEQQSDNVAEDSNEKTNEETNPESENSKVEDPEPNQVQTNDRTSWSRGGVVFDTDLGGQIKNGNGENGGASKFKGSTAMEKDILKRVDVEPVTNGTESMQVVHGNDPPAEDANQSLKRNWSTESKTRNKPNPQVDWDNRKTSGNVRYVINHNSGLKQKQQQQQQPIAKESKPKVSHEEKRKGGVTAMNDNPQMKETLHNIVEENEPWPKNIYEETEKKIDDNSNEDKVAQIMGKFSQEQDEPQENGTNDDGTEKKAGRNSDRLNELIKHWLDEADLLRLEHVVIAGQGDRLIGVKSENKHVQEFLNLVPAYLEKIKNVHRTVAHGEMPQVQKILTRKRFALCRDHFGASPLHLAVLHGHIDILIYIITQFPETIDGPDNDARTPMHYSAVLPDKQIYQILDTAGANKEQKDRFGYSPKEYLTNGKLAVRELLIKYSKDDPDLIKGDLWERPPTSEIISQLTPESGSVPSSANQFDSSKKDSSENQEPENGGDEDGQDKTVQILQIEPRERFVTSPSNEGDESQENEDGTVSEVPPVSNEDGAVPIGDSNDVQEAPLENGDIAKTENEDTDPSAPAAEATDTTQTEAMDVPTPKFTRSKTFDRSGSATNNVAKPEDDSKSPVDDRYFETLSSEFKRNLQNEKIRLQKSIDRQMSTSELIKPANNGSVIDSIQGAQKAQNSTIVNGLSGSGFDLTQIKDEHGRTVLHLSAATEQKRSTFYKMLEQASYLLPERDSKYRTIREVAVQNGIKNNLQVIDQFVLDQFIKQKTDYLWLLMMEGYNNLLTVVDADGNDAIATLRKNNITTMDNVIHQLAQLQKNRDELHTFIRHGYVEGVDNLLEIDQQLAIAKSDRGRTSLHLAVLFGNIDIIEMLINANHKAVNAPDNLGRTPLHYAMAMSKMEEIGRILIHSGADKAIRDVRMRTPTYYFVYKQEIRDIKREEQNLAI